MPLLNRYLMPHGGFPYAEHLPNSRVWRTANPFLPFDMIAEQIQEVRIKNPLAALNPTLEACRTDLDAYTCKRLKYHPKWCSPEGSAIALAQAAPLAAQPSTRTAVRRCGGCGARKAARAKIKPAPAKP